LSLYGGKRRWSSDLKRGNEKKRRVTISGWGDREASEGSAFLLMLNHWDTNLLKQGAGENSGIIRLVRTRTRRSRVMARHSAKV